MIPTPLAISPLTIKLIEGFLPSDLANLVWWYQDQFVITASPDIDRFTDLSGNGNHAIQGVALDKPHLVEDDIAGFNAAGFDGVRQYMDTSDPYQSDFRLDFAIVMVVKILDGRPPATSAFFGSRDGTDRVISRLNINGTVQFFYNDGATLANFISNEALSNDPQPYTICTFWGDFSGDQLLKIRRDGVDLASNGIQTGDTSAIVPANFTSARNLYIAARNLNGVPDRFNKMNSAESMFFCNPTLASILNVEDYLSQRYGIVI